MPKNKDETQEELGNIQGDPITLPDPKAAVCMKPYQELLAEWVRKLFLTVVMRKQLFSSAFILFLIFHRRKKTLIPKNLLLHILIIS